MLIIYLTETCSDVNSTIDTYISRMRELERGGVSMDGIGLEGLFTIPNPSLMRDILDKLATLGLPLWLIEVDISHTLGPEAQVSKSNCYFFLIYLLESSNVVAMATHVSTTL